MAGRQAAADVNRPAGPEIPAQSRQNTMDIKTFERQATSENGKEAGRFESLHIPLDQARRAIYQPQLTPDNIFDEALEASELTQVFKPSKAFGSSEVWADEFPSLPRMDPSRMLLLKPWVAPGSNAQFE